MLLDEAHLLFSPEQHSRFREHFRNLVKLQYREKDVRRKRHLVTPIVLDEESPLFTFGSGLVSKLQEWFSQFRKK